jgi:hypothetical protein
MMTAGDSIPGPSIRSTTNYEEMVFAVPRVSADARRRQRGKFAGPPERQFLT